MNEKLSMNEIRSRAFNFVVEWKGESKERAEAQTFWNEFFKIFGVSRRRVAVFEKHVKEKGTGNNNFIDCFWPHTLLCEHKSLNKNLDEAYYQALDYCDNLEDNDLPMYIIICDFEHFRLYDLESSDSEYIEFSLEELPENLELFGFISGYQKISYDEENPVNIDAAKKMGSLHDFLIKTKYPKEYLDTYIPRLLFCFFAEDTGIFEKNLFFSYIYNSTKEDGSDLGSKLQHLFQTLDTAFDDRSPELDEDINQFPYINGGLFKDNLRIPSFNKNIRDLLINLCKLDWSKISPAIFGSIFQSLVENRRGGGIHYTSEKNVKKVINSLFMNNLNDEFNNILKLKDPGKKEKLIEFHNKISQLKFLEPACGCGNFLIITYKELRELELKIFEEIYDLKQQRLDTQKLSKIDVDSFYGIEIEESSAKISEVSMWIMDHMMNNELSHKLGYYYVRLPLKKAAHIHRTDALLTDWTEILKPSDDVYVFGNPPFVDKEYRSKEQKNGMDIVFKDKVKSYKDLDYVAAWYLKASEYIQGTKIKVAFVSTNSITQGQQATLLWKPLMNDFNIKINFAHRTFKWDNEGTKKASVHTVIIGFSIEEDKDKYLFKYETVTSDPHKQKVNNINQYLLDAETIFVEKENEPLVKNIPHMTSGSKPKGKGFILTEKEKNDLILREPLSEKYVKRYLGAKDFLTNKKRYCLWLLNADIHELKNLKEVMKHVNSVKIQREKHEKEQEQKGINEKKISKTPTLFAEIRQPETDYILIPLTTTSRREYIPFGFVNKDVIASNAVGFIASNDYVLFGIISSKMHMVWMKYTCGRLKNDYRYTNNIYNTFPFPENITNKNKSVIKKQALAILDIRNQNKYNSLDDLYDPLLMPPELRKAHENLDNTIDNVYNVSFKNESERIKYLFEQYKNLKNRKNNN